MVDSPRSSGSSGSFPRTALKMVAVASTVFEAARQRYQRAMQFRYLQDADLSVEIERLVPLMRVCFKRFGPEPYDMTITPPSLKIRVLKAEACVAWESLERARRMDGGGPCSFPFVLRPRRLDPVYLHNKARFLEEFLKQFIFEANSKDALLAFLDIGKASTAEI
eukprot:jgi/Undpi1/8277/HiC_scaffold_25.g10746.m1